MSVQELKAAERECREGAVDALQEGDWYEAYLWSKSWIVRGGARLIEPWLIYAASALQQGYRKNAVHSCDLGLTWMDEATARSILRFVRGEVIRRHLNDPKTAQADLDAAAEACPSWLSTEVASARDHCAEEAAQSRKRKPSVSPAQEFDATADRRFVPDSVPLDYDLERESPPCWETVSEVLKSPDPRTGPRRGPKAH